jgi:hypothetical protein
MPRQTRHISGAWTTPLADLSKRFDQSLMTRLSKYLCGGRQLPLPSKKITYVLKMIAHSLSYQA